MLKRLLFFFLLAGNHALHAQLFTRSDTGGVRFDDVVEEMEEYFESQGVRKEHEEGEGAEHLFQRWKWKTQQQLDSRGYIVPFSKTVDEWNKYLSKHSKTAAKTTTSDNWILEGPTKSISDYAYIGRINVVAFDPVDSNTFYVGSPAGSTWKTIDGGAHWTVLYEQMPSNGVADIKINPQNRNTIYVVTGDYDGYDTRSAGIMVSHDAGTTWSTIWTSTTYYRAASLVINPLDTNTMMLATSMGLYRTINGGATWTTVSSKHFNQVLYNPANPTVVYGTTRSNVTFAGAQIMRSANGGVTWDSVTQFTNATGINLAVSPAYPAIVKAVACANGVGFKGLFSSSDSGKTYIGLDSTGAACTHNLLGWDTVVACTHQGTYDLCIAISPTDSNKVVIGGIFTYYSQDGGSTWQMANVWGGTPGIAYVHPDKHCLGYNPLSGALFEGSDGGIHKNYDPLASPWIDLTNGISVTEFYNNAVDNGVPFCIGGSQDNGSLLLTGGTVTNLTGYDGYHAAINHGDPTHIFYTTYQGSNMFITRDAGATYKNITSSLGLNCWNTPFELHPTDTATIVLGSDKVYATHNNGNTWAAISPVFNSPFGCLKAIRIAPGNPNYIYALPPTGNVLRYTTNFGSTWDSINFYLPSQVSAISDIAVDPHNEKRIWVTLSGYGTPKVLSYNLTSNTWTAMNGTLPDIPANRIAVDSFSGTLYIGNATSIFYRSPAMTDWALYNSHLPTVAVRDLSINYTSGEIWAATYGRGMWRSLKNEVPVNTLSTEQLSKSITIAPNPARNFLSIQSLTPLFRSGKVDIRLVGADGTVALAAQGEFDAAGKIIVNTVDVPPGFYICEMSNNIIMIRNKVVVY